MEIIMTKEEIAKVVFDHFNKSYGIDLSTFDRSYPLSRLKELNEKLDSLEVITFMSELEDIFKINTITIESGATTIEELIDYLYENIDKE
jgi:acyl carrier protein